MTGIANIRTAGETLSVALELAIYPLDAILRTCHVFTARCYVFAHDARDGVVVVDFTSKDGTPLPGLGGDFCNTLLDFTLRAQIAAETQTIRELLVAQAFCEGDLLDRRDLESSENSDPRGIAS